MTHPTRDITRRSPAALARRSRRWPQRARRWEDAGMAVAEYAIVTVAVCALGAVLFKVFTGGELKKELLGIFLKALRVTLGG